MPPRKARFSLSPAPLFINFLLFYIRIPANGTALQTRDNHGLFILPRPYPSVDPGLEIGHDELEDGVFRLDEVKRIGHQDAIERGQRERLREVRPEKL